MKRSREHTALDRGNALFPRAARYNPEWVIASAGGGANPLWLTEWLAESLELQPEMKVLDLGCGRAASSIFLHREFGVRVWAIVSIDSFPYYGTDDLYLNYLARFVKPGGQLGIAGAGLTKEIEGALPEHLREWWTPDLWFLHSPDWWRRHWERTGIVDIEVADSMRDGWQRWLDWHHTVAPDNRTEIAAVEADRGGYLGYGRVVGRRRSGVVLEEPITSLPANYAKKPLTKRAAKRSR